METWILIVAVIGTGYYIVSAIKEATAEIKKARTAVEQIKDEYLLSRMTSKYENR